MDDAGSKLLVLPARGNAAAEAAAAELGTPTATLSVARSGGAISALTNILIPSVTLARRAAARSIVF